MLTLHQHQNLAMNKNKQHLHIDLELKYEYENNMKTHENNIFNMNLEKQQKTTSSQPQQSTRKAE